MARACRSGTYSRRDNEVAWDRLGNRSHAASPPDFGPISRRTIMLTPESRLRDFPSLTDRAYLNTDAEGIPPPQVAAALAQYARDKELGMDGRPLHAAQWEATKTLVAEFYGLTAAEIGICS